MNDKTERAWKLLPLIPVAMLLTASLLNYYAVATRHSTPWFSVGFGMHATFDSPLFRFVRVYGVRPDGTESRIAVRQPGPFSPAFQHPGEAAFRRFLTSPRWLDRAERASYDAFRVEIWQFGYTRGTAALTTEFVTAATVHIEP
jgi:hypothetical protein